MRVVWLVERLAILDPWLVEWLVILAPNGQFTVNLKARLSFLKAPSSSIQLTLYTVYSILIM